MNWRDSLFWCHTCVHWVSHGTFLSWAPVHGLWELRALKGWFLQVPQAFLPFTSSICSASCQVGHKHSLSGLEQTFPESVCPRKWPLTQPSIFTWKLSFPFLSTSSIFLKPRQLYPFSRVSEPFPGLLGVSHSAPRIYHGKHANRVLFLGEILLLATKWTKIFPSCNKSWLY